MCEIIPSKVNKVAKISRPGRPSIVRKRFALRAVSTGIVLPLARSLIERRVSADLARRTRSRRDGITVAAYRAETSVISVIPYIEGEPLRSLPPFRWPKPGQMRELGRFIAEAERRISLPLFHGLVLASQRLGRIIRLYKTGSAAVRRGTFFSFGDATLANIVLTPKGLHLLDFEFAHLSDGGFDIAMLTTEIEQLIKCGMALRSAQVALMQGYIEAGGKLKSVLMWRVRLTKYQAKRATRNGG